MRRPIRVLLALLGGCSCRAEPGRSEPVSVPGPSATAPAAGGAGDVVRVLYSTQTSADFTDEVIRLYGVEADGGRAHLIRERIKLTDDAAWALETVDLKRGVRVSLWTARPENLGREYFTFKPVDGTVADGLVRFAALARATGPWGSRPTAHWIEAQPVPAGIIYRDDPRLVLADRRGRELRALADDSDGSWAPAPDGRRVAFVVRSDDPERRQLAIAEVGGGEPRRTGALGRLRNPMWSVDGSAIYAIRSAGQSCMLRVDARDLAVTELVCLPGPLASYAQDQAGATAAFMTRHGGGTAIRWIDLPTGRERGRIDDLPALAPQLEDVLIDTRGRLVAVTDPWDTVVAVDLATARVAELPAAPGFFEGIRATRWLGDRILLLRRRGSRLDVVLVDIARLLR